MAPADAVAAADDVINGSINNQPNIVWGRATQATSYMVYPAWQAALRQKMAYYSVDRGRVTGWTTQVSFGASDAYWAAGSRSQANLTVRYPGYGGSALEARFRLVKQMGRYRVAELDLVALGEDLARANEFDPTDSHVGREKSASQTLMLFVPLALICFLLVSTVSCLMTRDLPYKPAWLALIWVGAFEVSLNWTTGHFTVVPLTVSLPPVWFSQQNPWEPMFVVFLIPVGAIYYWIARTRRTPLPVCKLPDKEG